MSLPKIFIVDDNEMYATSLSQVFKRDLFQIGIFSNGKDYLNALDTSVDIAILDYHLSDSNGLELLKKSLEVNPELSVIILSAQTDISLVSPLYKFGAYCYIVKSETTYDELAHKVRNVMSRINMRKETILLEEELKDRDKYYKIIGNSPATLRMLKMIQRVEQTDANVMITGESGTGKELVAKAVHYNSKRRRKPFIAVNIAAIPSNLIEDELFGHDKGAFTGANGKRLGKFEEAQGGTLFLDEIGEMEVGLQAKLLRVLQERKMTRLGGNKVIKLDIRLITATHRNLAERVREGHFREDLFYRIQGFPIQAPELCDRGNDIILLSKHFLKAAAEKNRMPAKGFSEAAEKMLLRHRWPGNVRELIAVMERCALMSDSELVDVGDIFFTEGVSQRPEQPVVQKNNRKEDISEVVRMMTDAQGLNDVNKFGLYRKLVKLRHLEPLLNMLKKGEEANLAGIK